ncbi:hypothetical protein IAT40_006385 [Kwoniella sp. CBS 6097]
MSGLIAGGSRPLCRACTRSRSIVKSPSSTSVQFTVQSRASSSSSSILSKGLNKVTALHSTRTQSNLRSKSRSSFKRGFTTGTGTDPTKAGPSQPQWPSSPSGKQSRSRSRSPVYRRLALTIFGIAIPTTTSYFFFPSSQPITPHLYSNQPVTSTNQLTPQHRLIVVDIPEKSKEYFEKPYRIDGSLADVATPGEGGERGGEVVIQHMMIKSPDIQIERPYTPINDPVKDGQVRMVVKRVRGGEVGRVVHSLKEGDEVGIRGPIPTFSIYPDRYDKIIMISTGTAISPFLQLLSKLPSSPLSPGSSSSPSSATLTNTPQLHLIHAKPLEGRTDWADPLPTNNDGDSIDPSLIPSLQTKFGDRLKVTRIDPGYVSKEVILSALGKQVEVAHTLDQKLDLDRKRGWFSNWFGNNNKEVIITGEASANNSIKGKRDVAIQKREREEKIMVLICLPPVLMRPLCGGMTPNLDQGELTGLLAELGLRKDQVWKLE